MFITLVAKFYMVKHLTYYDMGRIPDTLRCKELGPGCSVFKNGMAPALFMYGHRVFLGGFPGICVLTGVIFGHSGPVSGK